jgi:hypothetical protein
MRRSSFALAAALMVEAAACTSAGGLVVQQVGEKPDFGERARPVHPGRNFHGHPGLPKQEVRLIRTKREWDALWPPGLEAPAINFSQEMVLAAFGGEQRGFGHRIVFEGAFEQGGALKVLLAVHAPAADCPVQGGIFRPSLLLTLPRRTGRTEVFLRRHEEKSCLTPPALEAVCRAAGNVRKFRNALPFPLPPKGGTVECSASSEAGAHIVFELLTAPEGSGAAIEKTGPGTARLTVPDEGRYQIGVRSSRGDGFVSSRVVDVEAGMPIYDIELAEEEPEGLRGYQLELVRVGTEADEPPNADAGQAESVPSDAGSADGGSDAPDDADEDERPEPEDVCSAAAPQKWCVPASDGYATHIALPSLLPDDVEIHVRRKSGMPPPQASLVVRLSGQRIFEMKLSDAPDDWPEDADDGEDKLVATLRVSEAVVEKEEESAEQASEAR